MAASAKTAVHAKGMANAIQTAKATTDDFQNSLLRQVSLKKIHAVNELKSALKTINNWGSHILLFTISPNAETLGKKNRCSL